MGKQKAKIRKVGRAHNPLDTDLLDHKQVFRKGRAKKQDSDDDGDDEKGMGVMPPKMTSKLLAMARQERMEADDDIRRGADPPMDDGDEYEDIDDEEDYDEELEFDDHTSAATDMSDMDPQVPELDPAEAAALAQFQPHSSMQCRTLADIILAKINEQKMKKDGDIDADEDGEEVLDKRIVRVYRTVGKLLKTYTAGRLPKAFKVLPRLQNWEDLLWLTKPHEWSAHSLYAATRLFASGLNEKMAQRYYYAFLLPSVTAAMETPRSEAKMILHPMRYNAVKKALFKPAAFIKGFLIPMCEDDGVTVQQALVIGTILHKCTIPAIPAAVALVKIAQMPFSPTRAVIMRSIVDKRLSLPFQAVDAMVKYFYDSLKDDRTMPVLWHQCLLTFLTKYGHEMVSQQFTQIRDVCHKHYHIGVTPDIHRELARLERK
jgi:essential nuclear protein 1